MVGVEKKNLKESKTAKDKEHSTSDKWNSHVSKVYMYVSVRMPPDGKKKKLK